MICPNCNKVVPDANYRCPYCRKVLKEQGVDPLAFQHEHMQKKSQHFTFMLLAAIVIGVAVLVYILFVKEGQESSAKGKTTEPRPAATSPQGRDANAASSTPSAARGTNQDTGTVKENADAAASEEIPLTANAGESGEKSDNPYDWVDKEDPEKLAKAHIGGEEIDIEKLLLPGKTTIFDFYSEYCPPCRKISPELTKLAGKRKDIAVVKIDINRKNIQGIDWSSPVAQQYQIRSIPHFIIYDSTGYRTQEGEEAYQRVMDLLKEEQIQ
ncbi:MAG TPA: thioredoxin family protein [Candidatus Kapabacteria bacterium]|nr:thioredoxin family protein [Candidatus Kapabacteria bacterium]